MDYPNTTCGRLVDSERGLFWEWTLSGQDLSTKSGKLGKSGRAAKKNYPTREKAGIDIEDKIYKKLSEGFQYLQADNPGPIALQTHLANAYTGFLSLDIDMERNLLAAVRHTGHGKRSCEVVVIDAASGGVQKRIPLQEFDVSNLQFFEGDLIIQSDDRIQRLNLNTGAVSLLGKDGVFTHLGFKLRTDRLLFSQAGSDGPVINVLDLRSGKTLLELDAREQRYLTDHRITHVGALSPSGKLVAICRRPGEIEIHDLETGRQRFLRGHFPCVLKMAFHPSERWLGFAELYGDWRFRLWQIKDAVEDTRFESLQYAFPDGSLRGSRECFDFAFSPDGKVVALRDQGWIRMHDFESQVMIARLQQRHVVKTFGTGGFRMLYAPDGRLLTRTDRGIVTVYEKIR